MGAFFPRRAALNMGTPGNNPPRPAGPGPGARRGHPDAGSGRPGTAPWTRGASGRGPGAPGRARPLRAPACQCLASYHGVRVGSGGLGCQGQPNVTAYRADFSSESPGNPIDISTRVAFTLFATLG
jgi:hypothetical protein